ncbi:tight adherence protein B [Selenomonas ruminantium]|uniref:Tight adherence protein B n=1 Tax=Selenomonas ruminantium TaxID=971 RepID=A0A1M6S3T2_SELRU|nr:type II secretion system F family protein [Selenomonas ruminantium]SHK39340.1 tight adherence protein B [Selenomonas ruminantium]
MVILAAMIAALAAFLLVLIAIVYVQHIRRLNIYYRLRRHKVIRAGDAAADQPYLFERVRSFLSRAASPIAERGPVQALDFRMRQAGIPLLGGEFMILLAGSAGVVCLIVWMLTLNFGVSLLWGVLAATCIWGLVSWRIYQRRNAFTEQLGDCLTTVANALRAGYSFPQAVDVVVEEMEPPISEEFAQVSREVGMSVPLEAALEALSRRVGSADLDLMVTAVLIQREVGGNLAQILDSISDTIQDRVRMKREIFSLTAQGRLSAWVLLVLPWIMALLLYIFRPEQLLFLVNHPFGRMALIGSFILEVIGYLVIQRIVNIDA